MHDNEYPPPPLPVALFAAQSGTIVALELMVDGQQGGFASLLGVIDRLRQRHGAGVVFASNTPAEVSERYHYIGECMERFG